ncbi:MAG TPA: hypothetical protein VGO11_17835 [Chthoniobacteraceae bacterium]|jgi:hypothetical protein|nr:hypothetical protein [Chthoniobacteraceae bacterium]
MQVLARSFDELLRGLPGEELIRPGLEDLAAGRESEEALLIEMAQTRLREAGLPVPVIPPASPEAELRLYALLGRKHDLEAHYQFGALTQRLDKFCRSLEASVRQRLAPDSHSG